MFTSLSSPELVYETFKLRERELVREAEMHRLVSLLRAGRPSRWHRLRVRAGGLLLSLGARLNGGAVSGGRPAGVPGVV